MRKTVLTVTSLVAFMAASAPASAAIVYANNLENGAGFTVNAESADTQATFGYDYSADGIGEAPNTMGGDTATTGLKLEANLVEPSSGTSLVVTPTGETFSGSYTFRFDAWINFDTDAFYNNGAAGTTEFIGGGVGYDGTDTGIVSGAQYIVTGDGGSGSDHRVFADGAFLGIAEMNAGTRNGFDPYYADFLPAANAPAGQQPGDLPGLAGSPAFQWVTFEFSVYNEPGLEEVWIDLVKPDASRLAITTIDCSPGGTRPCETEAGISVVYADFFSSVADQPQFQFGLIDNLFVTDEVRARPVDVSEAPTAALMLAGLAGFGLLRRRKAARA